MFCVSNGNICSEKCMALCMPCAYLLPSSCMPALQHFAVIKLTYPIHCPCPCAFHFLSIFRAFSEHFPVFLPTFSKHFAQHKARQTKQSLSFCTPTIHQPSHHIHGRYSSYLSINS